MTSINQTGCYVDSTLITRDCNFKCFIFGPTLAAFSVLVIVANITGIIVLRKSRQWPRMNLCLTALAAWEILLILASFFLYSVPNFMRSNKEVQEQYVNTYSYWYTTANISNQAGIWTVLVMATDRYFAICNPFRHRRFERRLKGKVLLIVAAFAALHGFPRFFEVTVQQCTLLPDNGSTISTVLPSGLQQNYLYRILYKIIGGLLLYSLGPFMTLSFIAVQVSKNLSHYAKTRRKLVEIYQSKSNTSSLSINLQSQERKKDQNKDQLLLVIILKFLTCHSLPTTLDIMETVGPENLFKTSTVNHLVDVSNILVMLNAGCNVLIYMALSQNFRYQYGKYILGMYGENQESVKSRASSKSIKRGDAPLLHKNTTERAQVTDGDDETTDTQIKHEVINNRQL